jgi:hypothetical protein
MRMRSNVTMPKRILFGPHPQEDEIDCHMSFLFTVGCSITAVEAKLFSNFLYTHNDD